MRIILVIITSFLMLSCSKNYEVFIDPQLQKHWNSFLAEADRLGVDLNVKDVMMIIEEPDYQGRITNGLCSPTKNGFVIRISPRMLKYSDTRIEATVFHELGHGLLGRSHNKNYYDSAYVYTHPKKGYTQVQSKMFVCSLMSSPNGYREWTNGKQREYYLRELFGLIKNYEEYAKQIGWTVKDLP